MPRSDESVSAFHIGGRTTFHRLYVAHFAAVERIVGRVLEGADKETVIQDVFCKLMGSPDARLGFRSGSLSAWIGAFARNHAVDFRRRRSREQPIGTDLDGFDTPAPTPSFEVGALARIVVERFRETALPKKWARVFDARFLQQLTQEEAAETLGMSRTTLAYQEGRIRNCLRVFANERAKDGLLSRSNAPAE